jgi:hypothetical protein
VPQSTETVFTTTVGGQARTITSTRQDGTLNGSNSSSSSFFDNSGAVGGTFAAVGVVALLLVALIAWLFYRRRKAQRMDADVVAAASAAAATTRTPFDDDDPEMIEDPAYGQNAQHYATGGYAASDGNGYEPSHFSSGTAPGFAGMGAYGAGGAAAGAGAGAAAAAAYGHYYDNGNGGYEQQSQSGGHYYDQQPDAYYGQQQPGQALSQGHEYSQGHEAYAQQAYDGYAPQQDQYGQRQSWGQPGHSPPLDADNMPWAAGALPAGLVAGGAGAAAGSAAARRRSGNQGIPEQLLGPNVFSDASPGEEDHLSGGHGGAPPSASSPDNRLDVTGLQRAGEAGSTSSLRDDQDYSRKVLSVTNNS